MDEELIAHWIEVPGGELRLLQPLESAELPDIGEVEWAPIVPYWSVLWRSGVALARELDPDTVRGRRVLELGCGLGVPSIVAARAGAEALATDADPDALALLERNAEANGARLETALIKWSETDELLERGPFDLVLASDVLYERTSVGPLLDLLPRLAPEALIADPGRAPAEPFLEQAGLRWAVETRAHGVVRIHRLRMDAVAAG
jgi:predicted nicotinamide N-methyase